MYPRVNYEMTEEALKTLMEACRPVPCMLIGGTSPRSPQENANAAWRSLGEQMGFDYMTVMPIAGKGSRFFSAVPLENEVQRKEREDKEKALKKQLEIAKIKSNIEASKKRLAELEDS